eukprot:4027692-Prymnesium_polylepis.1
MRRRGRPDGNSVAAEVGWAGVARPPLPCTRECACARRGGRGGRRMVAWSARCKSVIKQMPNCELALAGADAVAARQRAGRGGGEQRGAHGRGVPAATLRWGRPGAPSATGRLAPAATRPH